MRCVASDPCFITYFSGGNFHHLPHFRADVPDYIPDIFSLLLTRPNTIGYLYSMITARNIIQESRSLLTNSDA